jgi:hypothetical protein
MDTPRGSPQVRLVSSVAMLILVIAGVWYYAVRRSGELFDIGVNDHVQCGIAGLYPGRTQGLGDQFAPMLRPILDAAASDALVSAHQCTVGDRPYVHIILRRGSGRDLTLISVILTQRGAQEDFPRLSGTIHTGSRDGYSVAAFESGGYLAYIISTLPGRQNRELAVRLAPIIDRFTKA